MACVGGDEHALETLMTRYHRLVIATALRSTHDPDLAQDIAQTVFLIFVRKANGIAQETSLPGWFMRTTRFVVRDALKRLARRTHYETLAQAEMKSDPTSPASADSAMLLVDAIMALSPKEQVCVLARFYDDHSIGQIAQEIEGFWDIQSRQNPISRWSDSPEQIGKHYH